MSETQIKKTLKEIEKSLKDGKTSNEIKLVLSELVMKWEYEKNKNSTQNVSSLDDDMKYYTMGWYVYNCLLNKRNDCEE